MKKETREQKIYEGFSLIEMLVTMVIIGFVFLLVAVTLSTLIRVSSISTAKTTVRNDSEIILELIRRNVRNSNIGDVLVYNSEGRTYDGEVIVEDAVYGFDTPLQAGEAGNEIHFRPNGYSRWVCIGFFPDTNDPEMGYILKSSSDEMSSSSHSSCFNPEGTSYQRYAIQLNSSEVDINSFAVRYIESTYDNYIIIADIKAQSVYWYEGSGKIFNREVNRQVVVSTEGLTW